MKKGNPMQRAPSGRFCGSRDATAGLFVGLLASILLLSTAESASAQTLDHIRDTGVLRVGYRQDARPFSYQDEAKAAAGYSVALCQKIADAVKAELQLSELRTEFVPFGSEEDGLGALRQGNIDLHCAATTVTLSRRASVSFSIPIFPNGIGALMRKDAPARMREILVGRPEPDRPRWRASLAQILRERTFAVHKGTAEEKWLDRARSEFKIVAKVEGVEDYDVGVGKVVGGEADVLFGDRTALLAAAARSPSADDLMVIERLFTYEPLALALKRGDEDFRLLADRALSQVYGSSEIAELYKSFFGEADDATLRFLRMTALPE
jgi:polar amino acid transport system substrate-binding protein